MSSFKFIEMRDCGSTNCPHCGSEGRYIYTWEQDGKVYSAMAGCYKALTGKLEKGEASRFYEILAEKVVKNKTLNGWDKAVLRMQEYIKANITDVKKVIWAENKIGEALSQRKKYLAKKRY